MGARHDAIRMAACAVVSASVFVVAAGCENNGSVPPPPIKAPDRPLSQLEGNPAATMPTDANLVASRVKAHIAELEANKSTDPERPRISDPSTPTQGSPGATVTTPPAATPAPATPNVPPSTPPSAPPSAAVDVSPSTGTPSGPTSPPAAGSPNQPSIGVAPLGPPSVVVPPSLINPTPASLGMTSNLDAEIAGRVSRDPRDVSAALDAQLLAYLKGQPVPDAAAIAALPTEDRELVSAVIDSLVNFRAGVRAEPNADYATKVRPLAEMGDRLKTRSDLSVPVFVPNADVRSFGIYTPQPAVLSSRVETQLRMYYEVANFTSRFTDKRVWETRLGQQITLYDGAGHAVWQDKMETWNDTCRNRRNDFYIATALRVPGVPPGRYTLKVTLTDLNVGRVAEAVSVVEAR